MNIPFQLFRKFPGVGRSHQFAGLAFLILVSCSSAPSLKAGHSSKAELYRYDSTRTAPLLQSKGGVVLTDSVVAARLKRSEFMVNGGDTDFAVLKEFADSAMCDTLAGLEAGEVDLPKHPLEFRLYREQYYQFLYWEYWRQNVDLRLTVDSADALKLYHDSAHLFTVQEQVDVSHIYASADGFLANKDSAYYATFTKEQLEMKAEERIWMLWRMLNFGEPFQNVAYDYSHDWRTRRKGGYIGWTLRGVYQDPFDSIAFSLPHAKYSRPYKDSSGWQILLVSGHLLPGPVPIDSPNVFSSALASARTVKSNLMVDSLYTLLTAGMKVVPNEKLLDTNYFLVDDFANCGVVNGRDTIEGWRAKQMEDIYRRKFQIANTSREQKLALLRDIGGFLTVVQEAKRTGIDTIPAMKLKQARSNFYFRKQVIQHQAYDPGYMPDDRATSAYYASARDRFNPTRPYTFDLLSINDSAFGDFCWVQLQAGFDMPDLMKEYDGHDGHTVTIRRYDSVGQKELPEAIFRAALGTPLGKYSRPFTFGGNRHILKLIEAREPKSLLLARPEIVIELCNQHREEVWRDYRDRLFRKYGVKRLVPLAGRIRLAPEWERLDTAEKTQKPAGN